LNQLSLHLQQLEAGLHSQVFVTQATLEEGHSGFLSLIKELY
jgi:hypothetical protein